MMDPAMDNVILTKDLSLLCDTRLQEGTSKVDALWLTRLMLRRTVSCN